MQIWQSERVPKQISNSNASKLAVSPFRSDSEVFSMVQVADKSPVSASRTVDSDVAYLHHTSGTSTGLPKPIPQTHHGALGVLPTLDGTGQATFTTTPLYHGGVADLFRAWTSNALIWLFPGKDLPITASNTLKCLGAADEVFKTRNLAPVSYFSSVPYVLQMMAADSLGLQKLQEMSLVGVGGAALPAEIGSQLVDQGVNLVSRFGSAECGFILSSTRKFKEDQDWQYVRMDEDEPCLEFEDHGDGLHELVVKSGWPHMAKTNRDDGSYASSDLFEAHPSISNAWKYHSRADSQLTLLTGKKFDPEPLERALSAATDYLDEVMFFGNGRSYPGVLLFRSSKAVKMSDADLLKEVGTHIEKLNSGNQRHAQISKHMLVPMRHSKDALPKSSKGTVMRRSAEERYAKEIDGAYTTDVQGSYKEVPDSQVQSTILEIVNSTMGLDSQSPNRVTDDTDLFESGVDSVASIRIRQAILGLLQVPQRSSLPLTVVEDAGTVTRLTNYVIAVRQGRRFEQNQNMQDVMQDLARKYSVFDKSGSGSEFLHSSLEDDIPSSGINVLLTGPTGSLGSHLLYKLLRSPEISHIYLLVRGASPHAAKERVIKSLTSRCLPLPPEFESKVTILPCRLSSPDLGLTLDQYQLLADRIDVVAHLAWTVNFLVPLRTFTSHLSALQNLVNFALSSSKAIPPKFLFCSTVAAASQHPFPISEAVFPEPSVSGPTGYAQSKWVAEQICAAADLSTHLRGRISIVRVGQLSGSSETGVWAEDEAYPLILSTYRETKCLPDLDAVRAAQSHDGLGKEDLNWLPVDTAANAFAQLIVSKTLSQDHNDTDAGDSGLRDVYHLLSPPRPTSTSWSDLVRMISKYQSDPIEIIPVKDWLDKLESLEGEDGSAQHPAVRLVSFWREAYGMSKHENGVQAVNSAKTPSTGEGAISGGFDMTRTLQDVSALKDARDLDEEYMMKLWARIQHGA